jgi:hypothetical protein
MFVSRIVAAQPYSPNFDADLRAPEARPSSALIEAVIEHFDEEERIDAYEVELSVSEARVQALLLSGRLHRTLARLSDVRVRWDEDQQQMVEAAFLPRSRRSEEDVLWEEFRARAA